MDKVEGDGGAPAIRVLLVVGTGRSGSTVVANLLGSIPGLVSLGELRYFWERGLRDGDSCGCGLAVPECPFWQGVLRAAYGMASPNLARIITADHQLLRLRQFPTLLRHRGSLAAMGPTAAHYAAELRRLYGGIATELNGAIIVDSSKLVSYAHIVRQLPGVDVKILHLVRDPRGAAFSWSRRRQRSDRGAGPAEMGRENLVKSVALWTLWNGAAELLWARGPDRYTRVRYEEIIADPRAALQPILRMLEVDNANVEPVGPDTFAVPLAHTVAGNPNRMATGAIRLRADVEWITKMPTWRKAVATLCASPLIGRYGYPFVVGKPRTNDPSAPTTFVEDMTGPRRQLARLQRNATWVREQGLRRVLEEKEIDPLRTGPAALRKAHYRRSAHHPTGTAMPVFVVGLQRSGTNMLVRGLSTAPEVEEHNENDRRAFDRYKLRSNETIESLIGESRHSHVLFKPLCDSHRIDRLLAELHTATPGRAVWAYRDVDGRVKSALAKFGDGNRQVLKEFAEGTNVTRWHVQRMSPESVALVRSFDYDTMSPASGAALMWLIRNRLYFDLGLDRRPDVQLISYNSLVADPEPTMRRLCTFLRFPYRASLVQHVKARPATYQVPLDIDLRVREQCEALWVDLQKVAGP